eukprot:jgi/Mesvir1/13167/Mv06131-RA.1
MRGFRSSAVGSARGWSDGKDTFLNLSTISDNPGARKKPIRVGRGIGSGKGKTAGRGRKGQNARGTGKVFAGFEGGQTPMQRRVPKRGFVNRNEQVFFPLRVDRLRDWVLAGRIDPSQLITMKMLRDSGLVGHHVHSGVKLFAKGAEGSAPYPAMHLEVSRVTTGARDIIEQNGGSVTTVHYNRLGLQALLKPGWFEKKQRLLPRSARPAPRLWGKSQTIGRLPEPHEPLPLSVQRAVACRLGLGHLAPQFPPMAEQVQEHFRARGRVGDVGKRKLLPPGKSAQAVAA